jgi:hypothetical protein
VVVHSMGIWRQRGISGPGELQYLVLNVTTQDDGLYNMQSRSLEDILPPELTVSRFKPFSPSANWVYIFDQRVTAGET